MALNGIDGGDAVDVDVEVGKVDGGGGGGGGGGGCAA